MHTNNLLYRAQSQRLRPVQPEVFSRRTVRKTDEDSNSVLATIMERKPSCIVRHFSASLDDFGSNHAGGFRNGPQGGSSHRNRY